MFYIEEHSNLKKFMVYLMLFNKIYIALVTPFLIGFNIEMRGAVLVTEIISHVISLVCFLLAFRKPVSKESGELTLDFKDVFKHYRKNGFWLDLIAFLPFNLILPCYFTNRETDQYVLVNYIAFLATTPLRMLRIITVSRCI